MCATAWAPVVFLGQFKDSQRGARGHIRGHPTRLGKFLLCLLVGAHFLEDWHAVGRRLDYFRALFIERSDQGVPRVGIDVADVLHVGTLAEMEALAWL